MSTDWAQWHDTYSRPGSALVERLEAVRAQIDRRLAETAPNPVRVISACSGDGRDLLGVLDRRSDANRVTALLVEYDGILAGRARDSARGTSANITVHQADAARSDQYAEMGPADLVLLCGIFGNISDGDVRLTIESCPQLCAPGAEVVWTRRRASQT